MSLLIASSSSLSTKLLTAAASNSSLLSISSSILIRMNNSKYRYYSNNNNSNRYKINKRNDSNSSCPISMSNYFKSMSISENKNNNHYANKVRQFSSANPATPSEKFETVGYSLLPVVNKLQEITSLIGSEIKLPQIVVVGSQSSGKSSVLENLVGRDFLPRGSGLVTRRPLVLQLIRIEDNSEWGEFGHTGDVRFNFEGIRDEIEAETNRVAGANKEISSDPIILKVFSPHVIPLTLVDLPGITRVPIGNQPTNIEERIRDMVLDYISNPNSIILAISAANQDIVTSDAIKLAKEVDPDGKRTIGVLTKLDLMDRGTDAMDILLGHTIPLKLGFVGIINRSQQDIINKKAISTMLKDEERWFQNHTVYSRIANQTGSIFLAQKCNKILTKHIRESMPGVKNQIRALINKYREELENYGEPTPERSSDKSRLLIDIMNKFALQFRADLEGVNDDQLTDHINGGARIRYIFSQAFKNTSTRPFDWLTDQQLRLALRNSSGIRPTMFIPQKTFDSLIKIQIEKLKDPAVQCADLVLDELLRILTQVDSNIFSRFPVLRERIVEVANNVLRKLLSPTNKMISDIVDAECSYINTSHPTYTAELNRLLYTNTKPQDIQYTPPQQERDNAGGSGLFSFIFGGKKQEPAKVATTGNTRANQTQQQNLLYGMNENYTDEEKKQINLLKRLLHSYFEIAQFNVQENTIKIISHFLIDRSKDILQRELSSILYDENMVDHLLRENEVVVARRKECIHKLEILKKAKKSLSVTELKDMPLQLY